MDTPQAQIVTAKAHLSHETCMQYAHVVGNSKLEWMDPEEA